MDKNESEEIKEKEEYVTYPGDDGITPIARYNVALDEAKIGEDRYWEVKRTVKQVVTFDNKTWYIREKSIKAIDKNFAKANKVTHNAMGRILADYNEDFFSKGKWEGHQYVMNTKDLDSVKVEEHHGIVEDVSDKKA